jgi:prepilin-type N-terminal cleavage/methylation domain-containing protein
MRPPLRHRLLEEESGYSLIELLIVLIFIGILLSIAVPSYLGLKDRSYQAAARSNLRNVIPAVIEYGADNAPKSRDDPDLDVPGGSTDEGYQNIDAAHLQSHYDPTLDTTKYQVAETPSGTYCAYTWVDAWTAFQDGPSKPIAVKLSSSFHFATDCT